MTTYFLEDKNERPEFTYAVFDYTAFSKPTGIYLYPRDEFEEALDKLKALSTSSRFVGLYEVCFNTEDREWRFKKTFNIGYDMKVRYDNHADVAQHCKFWTDTLEWKNPWDRLIRK